MKRILFNLNKTFQGRKVISPGKDLLLKKKEKNNLVSLRDVTLNPTSCRKPIQTGGTEPKRTKHS